MYDYKIVEGNRKDLIEQEVKTLLNKGWNPFGVLNVISTGSSLFYARELIKTIKPVEK